MKKKPLCELARQARDEQVPKLVLEEALDALLVRVRWYATRGYADSDVPESTRLAFNYLANALGKPHENPWRRLRVP